MPIFTKKRICITGRIGLIAKIISLENQSFIAHAHILHLPNNTFAGENNLLRSITRLKVSTMDRFQSELALQIHQGKHTFAPENPSQTCIDEFQIVAKALRDMDGRGYFDEKTIVVTNGSTGKNLYAMVRLHGGLSYQGIKALERFELD
jgi:hypothetical protein